MTHIHRPSGPAFHVVAGAPTPAYSKDGEHLGALVATLVHSASGETQYALLAVKDDPHGGALVPIPWAILNQFRLGERCVADVDWCTLAAAPHCREAELGHFDTDLAARVDGAYGLEFPGIETLNDLA